MPSEKEKARILAGRRFIRYEDDGDDHDPSDQQLKLPQPPLVKAPMATTAIDLPKNYRDLKLNGDILDILFKRESHRVFTDAPMTLLTLAYLLWATQGIKSIRGQNYATLRTVPCGGARHEFETYLIIRHVEGLEPGAYHYLPMTHQIEYLGAVNRLDERIETSLSGQAWAATANVVFYWSVLPYRSEWRYSAFAHRIILVDAGHVCQNLYVACESAGIGTCAVGAFDLKTSNALFGLDGEDEFVILAAPVGTVSAADKAKEDAFYAFLKNES